MKSGGFLLKMLNKKLHRYLFGTKRVVKGWFV